jgi:gamma-glutamyltranspeptidase/glutathione hydrolase
MTLEDLKAYKPKATPGLCRPYRVYIVCAAAGAVGRAGVLEASACSSTPTSPAPNDAQGWYLFSQASRLMYADRDRYIGDPTSSTCRPRAAGPGLPRRARQADRPTAARPRRARQAQGRRRPRAGPHGRACGTTHFVIVDKWGNVVSMTTTVESTFGSGRMVDGFFLNNQLTDFSFAPTERDGAPAANAVAGGKRPRSSMAPAIVLDKQHRFVAAVGSPGGPSIIAYNLKALVGMLDWKLPCRRRSTCRI